MYLAKLWPCSQTGSLIPGRFTYSIEAWDRSYYLSYVHTFCMNFQAWTAGTMGELMLVSVEVLHFLPMLNLSLCQTMVNANVGLVYWLVHGI
jgi:hypothetical protein